MQKNPLYIEINTRLLFDYKMGTLDNQTWRRTMGLFLIARKHSCSSALPSIAKIALSLHTTPEDILSVLNTLEQIGIARKK
jgi:hypothetical protein